MHALFDRLRILELWELGGDEAKYKHLVLREVLQRLERSGTLGVVLKLPSCQHLPRPVSMGDARSRYPRSTR